jgi:hypothetical protein
MDHILWRNHELLHRIAAVGHLLHHILLGLARALLFDADPASLLLPHGVVEGKSLDFALVGVESYEWVQQ